ncbi:MAG: WD40/YVTN/BNR-like repeat-containing protein [Prolixibacteraceae bacterium]
MLQIKLIAPILLLLLAACSPNSASKAPYTWKNVQIVGGGFVDGIVFHPAEKNLYYARTDMGGAYRWNEATKSWIPLLDWVSYADKNLMGVESIALDPNAPDKLYLACGTYTNPDAPNGEMLLSINRGESFERVPMPIKMGGNENGRGNGERLAVDPANGNIIYFGSRNDGLWRSTNAGHSWEQVSTFPVVVETPSDTLSDRQKGMWQWAMKGSGVITVIFDPSSANEKGCQTIYAAYSLMNQNNLFQSIDGGKTWNPVPGHPQQYRPTHCILAGDGNLYITYGDMTGPFFMYDGGVWKFNTQTKIWKEITPDQPNHQDKKFGYAAVAVDATNPEHLIVSSFYRPGNAGSDDIFRSTDGGDTWIEVFANGTEFDYSLAPYVEYTPIHWMCDIEIDPFDPNHALFTTGFGGFETFNLSNVDKGEKTNWSVYTKGIEETVPLQLCSPPEGAPLITGIGDYAGFVHWDLDVSAEGQYFKDPYFGNCDDVTCAEKNPSLIVRVGIASGHHGGSNIGYSIDFGKTWQAAQMPTPKSGHGKIALSADGATWIWTPQRQQPYRTLDSGNTWTLIDSLPVNVRVVADRVNPLKFYALDLYKGSFYSSIDGAKTFEKQELQLANGLPERGKNRGDNRGGQDRLYTTPGFENDLWLPAFDGLYHSKAKNETFELLQKVDEIHAFGFGKSAPGSNYPALYLIGNVDGQRGIYRSDDQAKNWVRINDDQHQWGLLLLITGDPKKYGRVYVGSHGRGALYGDPTK